MNNTETLKNAGFSIVNTGGGIVQWCFTFENGDSLMVSDSEGELIDNESSAFYFLRYDAEGNIQGASDGEHTNDLQSVINKTRQFDIFFNPSHYVDLSHLPEVKCIECKDTKPASDSGKVCQYCGHHLYMPHQIVTKEFFSEDKGYSVEDLAIIESLRVSNESGDEFATDESPCGYNQFIIRLN